MLAKKLGVHFCAAAVAGDGDGLVDFWSSAMRGEEVVDVFDCVVDGGVVVVVLPGCGRAAKGLVFWLAI